jgi:methylglyoxal synthase
MEPVELKEDKKTIALVAHDSQMDELLSWASFYRDLLTSYEMYAPETTANLLIKQLHMPVYKIPGELLNQICELGLPLTKPLVDFVVFFWAASEAFPDDPDIKALLNLANLYHIPIAGNRSAADFLFPLALASGDSGLDSKIDPNFHLAPVWEPDQSDHSRNKSSH